MSSLSPPPPFPVSVFNAPPLPHVTVGEIWTFTNIVLVFIFVILLIRLLFIYISFNRNQNRQNPNTSTQDVENNNTKGLTIDVINTYKTFPYEKIQKAANSNIGNSNYGTSCSICLSDYKDLEILRVIPVCEHYFHRDCLDVWLKVNGSCPICRNSPSLEVVMKA